MKAIRSGTLSEQRRYEQGWKSAKQRATRPSCKTCPFVTASGIERGSGFPDLMRYRCREGDFSTAPGAICKKHPEYREDQRGRVL